MQAGCLVETHVDLLGFYVSSLPVDVLWLSVPCFGYMTITSNVCGV